MRQFAIAIYAAFLAGCSFGVTFAPKEYVDRMDATNRDFVIEYVNAEVGNLVRKDNGGYILATNRAMTAIQQHQSLLPMSNYVDSVVSSFIDMIPVVITNGHYEISDWVVYTNGAVAIGWGAWSYDEDATAEGVAKVLAVAIAEEYAIDGIAMSRQTVPEYTEPQWGDSYEIVVPYETYYEDLEVGDVVRIERTRRWRSAYGFAMTNDIPSVSASVTHETVTNIVRDISRGGIWDSQLEVWWTPIMENGALKYVATTNVDLSAEVEQ